MRDREEFDADREYVTAKAMRVAGTDYTVGQEFPKHVVDDRRLRQLYDQHYISMGAPAEPPYVSPTARFDGMTMDELRGWLTSHGLVPRVSWERGKLLEKAAALV